MDFIGPPTFDTWISRASAMLAGLAPFFGEDCVQAALTHWLELDRAGDSPRGGLRTLRTAVARRAIDLARREAWYQDPGEDGFDESLFRSDPPTGDELTDRALYALLWEEGDLLDQRLLLLKYGGLKRAAVAQLLAEELREAHPNQKDDLQRFDHHQRHLVARLRRDATLGSDDEAAARLVLVDRDPDGDLRTRRAWSRPSLRWTPSGWLKGAVEAEPELVPNSHQRAQGLVLATLHGERPFATLGSFDNRSDGLRIDLDLLAPEREARVAIPVAPEELELTLLRL